MLEHFFISVLFGDAIVILFKKWKVDDYFKTSNRWANYWPVELCYLCLGFWASTVAFFMLYNFKGIEFLIYPLAMVSLIHSLQKIKYL